MSQYRAMFLSLWPFARLCGQFKADITSDIRAWWLGTLSGAVLNDTVTGIVALRSPGQNFLGWETEGSMSTY